MSNTCSVFPGVQSVMTVHDLMRRGRRRDRVNAAIRSAGLGKVGRLVATTRRGAEELLGLGLPHGVVRCIPFGMRERRGSDRERKHVLMFAGSGDPRKRVELAIRGYEAYRKRDRDGLPLVIIGRAGISPSHRAMLVDVGAEVVESPSEAEVDLLMEEAAVLLYPTRLEGFGLPIVEAAECATAVIISSDADLPEEVLGKHVTRTPSSEPEDWGEVIEAVISDGAPLDAGLGLENWPGVANAYAQLYREVRDATLP
jgi:glycosyltransferase involved in cell wall biosynthesis